MFLGSLPLQGQLEPITTVKGQFYFFEFNVDINACQRVTLDIFDYHLSLLLNQHKDKYLY